MGWAVLALALGTAGGAPASHVTVTGFGQPSGAFNIQVGGLGSPANGTYAAGRFSLSTSIGQLFTWCVDVFRSLHTPQTYAQQPFAAPAVTNGHPTTPMVLTADQVNAVVGLALAGNDALDTPGPNTGLFAGIADNLVSAAVQAAIWKVINPTGSFTATGGSAADRNTVNNLIATLTNASNLASFRAAGAALPVGQAVWLTPVNAPNGRGQAQIWIGPPPPGAGGSSTPVPAPGALLLLGVGLLGLLAVRRRA